MKKTDKQRQVADPIMVGNENWEIQYNWHRNWAAPRIFEAVYDILKNADSSYVRNNVKFKPASIVWPGVFGITVEKSADMASMWYAEYRGSYKAIYNTHGITFELKISKTDAEQMMEKLKALLDEKYLYDSIKNKALDKISSITDIPM